MKHRIGCFALGLFWCAVFAVTLLAGTMGDCLGVDCEAARETTMHLWLLGELLLLLVVVWIFYRAEMKDGEF